VPHHRADEEAEAGTFVPHRAVGSQKYEAPG